MFINEVKRFAEEILDFRRQDDASTETREKQRMTREKIPAATEAKWRYQQYWTTAPLPEFQTAKLVELALHFTDERLRKIVVPVISVNSVVSLRSLDFFVINICKHEKITFQYKNQIVNVYDSYRSFLRHQTRASFDAFRRGIRLYFDFDGWTYSTTVGQLNYLMWAENFGILYYAHGHIRQIETTMNTRIQHCKKIKKQRIKAGIRKVRSNLAPESVGRCQVFKTPVLIRFDMDESTKTDASS